MARVAVFAFVAFGLPIAAVAHPGGLEQQRLSPQSRTGSRHCHNGGSGGGEEAPFVAAAEVGTELGRALHESYNTWIVYQLGGYLHHDATAVIVGGITFHYGALHGPAVMFLDFGLGASLNDELGNAFAFRTSGGVKVALAGDTASGRGLHLKAALMME